MGVLVRVGGVRRGGDEERDVRPVGVRPWLDEERHVGLVVRRPQMDRVHPAVEVRRDGPREVSLPVRVRQIVVVEVDRGVLFGCVRERLLGPRQLYPVTARSRRLTVVTSRPCGPMSATVLWSSIPFGPIPASNSHAAMSVPDAVSEASTTVIWSWSSGADCRTGGWRSSEDLSVPLLPVGHLFDEGVELDVFRVEVHRDEFFA